MQTGLSEVDWGAWETTWTGERVIRRRVESTTTSATQTNVTGVNFTSNTQNTGRANVNRSGSGRIRVNVSLRIVEQTLQLELQPRQLETLSVLKGRCKTSKPLQDSLETVFSSRLLLQPTDKVLVTEF